MNRCSDIRAAIQSTAQSVTGIALLVGLAACSTFGPGPYDSPAYVLDEYGMVYGAVPGRSQDEGYLAPRFSVYGSGLRGSPGDYRYDSLGSPLPGFFDWRGDNYRYSPFYPGAIRAPIHAAPLPGQPPAVGQPEPVRPIASPVLTPPVLRMLPEPGFVRPGRRDTPFSRHPRSTTRAGIRARSGRVSRASQPRRTAPDNAAPTPRRAPSRPRVIDP